MQFNHPASCRIAAAALILGLALGAATPAFAQWKWRDKNGHITVSDRPPPRDIAEADILQRPNVKVRRAAFAASEAASGVAAASAPKAAVDKELEAKKRAADQEQQAKVKADEDKLAGQRAENCKRARAQAAALDTGQRMARFNDKGEREVLDDKGRADEMRKAREVVASDCK